MRTVCVKQLLQIISITRDCLFFNESCCAVHIVNVIH